MNLDLDDRRFISEGAVSLERGVDYIKPWRVPFEQRLLFGKTAVDDMMLSRAGMPAGVRLAFRSETTSIEGSIAAIVPNEFNVPETFAARLDVACDGHLCSTFDLAAGTSFRIDGLPGRPKWVELWLPEYREFRLRTLCLSAGATIEPHHDERRRWLVYGSSYTQSRGAASPWFAWPAVAARVHRRSSLRCCRPAAGPTSAGENQESRGASRP